MSQEAALEEYVVSKNLCIDCNACYTTYPEIFKQVPFEGETKAEAYNKAKMGQYNPWDVIGVCPTDAISKLGEMPAKAESSVAAALPVLEDLGPWEERYASQKHLEDSKWEVMRRYGMAASVTETANGFLVKVEFPATTPMHITKFKMGLPDLMPDYDYKATLQENEQSLLVSGALSDPHIKKLCGKINSFPDRFSRTFRFETPVKILKQNYRGKILTLELQKTAPSIH